MTMLEDLLAARTGATVITTAQVPLPRITATVVVDNTPPVAAPVAPRSDVLVEGDEWDWRALRDYVEAQIERCSGPYPKDTLRDSGIYKGFVKRWGADAHIIARAAFEVFDGYWRGAPVRPTRFTEGNDDYFARPLMANIRSIQS